MTVAQNNETVHRILRALGFSPSTCDSIVAEVRYQFYRFVSMRDFRGAIEDQDLWAIAVAEVWETARRMPEARAGLLRLYVRWAIGAAIKREARAHGIYIASHRIASTSRDAAQWPRCACGEPVGARQAYLCPQCRRDRKRARWRESKRRRRQRQLQAAA